MNQSWSNARKGLNVVAGNGCGSSTKRDKVVD